MTERDERGLLALVLALALLSHACTPAVTARETHIGTGVAPYVWIPWWASPAVLCLNKMRLAWSPVGGWDCTE